MEGTPVTVETVREVGPDTVALELSTPADFDARPGQFVVLRAEVDGEEYTRYYTLSSPSVGETFEITVGIDPEGDLSPWLAGLEGGEPVHVDGPFGEVTYAGETDVVCLAGGPGVGPAVAIAEAAHDAGHRAAVIYRDDAPAHEARLDALADDGAPVAILDPGDDAGLERAVAEHLADGQFFVFGFADFLEAVTGAIEEAGGDPEEALMENFG